MIPIGPDTKVYETTRDYDYDGNPIYDLEPHIHMDPYDCHCGACLPIAHDHVT